MTYDPTIGRFLEVDPIQFQSGTFDLYGYTANNPTNMIDPSGLEATHPGVSVRGDFDGGFTIFSGWKILSAVDIVKVDAGGNYKVAGTLNGIGRGGIPAESYLVPKAENLGDYRIRIASGMEVLVDAQSEGGKRELYWRQYATLKTTSANAALAKEGTIPRELDGGSKRYPAQTTIQMGEYYDAEMHDRPAPGQKAPIPAPLLDKTTTPDGTIVKPLDARGYTAYANAVAATFGKTNTKAVYTFETELIAKTDGKETTVGTWAWGLTVTWPEKAPGVYAPVVEINSPKWTKAK